MQSTLKVLVYGATGMQARPLVHKLLAAGHEPHILTRHSKKAADLAAAGAKIVLGSLDDAASLRAASEGKDVVALLIPAFLDKPTEAAQYGRNAIDAAQAAGVRLLVWNVSGPLVERGLNALADSRFEVLDYLKASGLPYVVLEPIVYAENLLGPWTAPSVAYQNQVAYPILPTKKVGWLPLGDLASLILAALERPELTGSHFKISGGDALTGPELAQIFSEVLGREITYYTMSPEEMGAILDNAFGPGAGEPVASEYRRQQSDPDPTAHYREMQTVLEKLPVLMTPLREWVAQFSSAFIPAEVLEAAD